jgi:hypothetical protein
MTESTQFENPKETEMEDKTATDAKPREKIDRIADKAAEKAGKTEQKYDKDHTIFSN